MLNLISVLSMHCSFQFIDRSSDRATQISPHREFRYKQLFNRLYQFDRNGQPAPHSCLLIFSTHGTLLKVKMTLFYIMVFKRNFVNSKKLFFNFMCSLLRTDENK